MSTTECVVSVSYVKTKTERYRIETRSINGVETFVIFTTKSLGFSDGYECRSMAEAKATIRSRERYFRRMDYDLA